MRATPDLPSVSALSIPTCMLATTHSQVWRLTEDILPNLSDSFAKLFRSHSLAFNQGAPVCAYLVWNRLEATSETRSRWFMSIFISLT